MAVEQARSLVATDPVASRVQVGGAEDLDRPIGELLEEQRRLLIVDRMRGDEDEVEWERDDSYGTGITVQISRTSRGTDHEVYDTDDPAKIVSALQTTHDRNVERYGDGDAALERMPGTGPLPGCIYQLQATPTKSAPDSSIPCGSGSWGNRRLGRHRRLADLLEGVEPPRLHESQGRPPHLLLGQGDALRRAGPGRLGEHPTLPSHRSPAHEPAKLNDFVDPLMTEIGIEKTRQRAGLFRH